MFVVAIALKISIKTHSHTLRASAYIESTVTSRIE